MLSLKEGEKLVRLARSAVEKFFEKGKLEIEKVEDRVLKERKGVFVTIETFPEKNLRGCIGFPHPASPLFEAVQRAAYCSAFEDTRFDPLKKEEIDKIVFEISVMTRPELIEVKDPKEYFEKIEIGRDGLILMNEYRGSLLLPQVPLIFDWDVKEFLENLFYKAGLTLSWIYDRNTRIWKFQAQIFAEKEPRGKVIERILK